VASPAVQAPSAQNYNNGRTVMPPEVVEVAAWSAFIIMWEVCQLAQISSAAWRRLAPDLATQKRRFQEIQRETALYRMEMGDHSEEENVIPPEWW
jgi:hypothetical protein